MMFRRIQGPLRRAAAIAALPLLAFSAHAVDRHVPSQYPDIRSAVNACAPGDRVILANGVSSGDGNRDIQVGPVMIMSASGNPSVCIIDCGAQEEAFIFSSAADNTAGVSGITIRNGVARQNIIRLNGGAIRIDGDNTNLLITNCVFENCTGNGGGAIAVHGSSSPTISGCVFRQNRAHITGGAISIEAPNADCLITNCVFESNDAADGGGAIIVHGAGGPSAPTISNCRFLRNNSGGEGGGILAYESSPRIVNCILDLNTTDRWGGGMALISSFAAVSNCTLVRNTAPWGGQALYINGGFPIVTNSIIEAPQNPLDQTGGLVTYCDIEGSGLPPAPDAWGNFDADSLLYDLHGGLYYPRHGSPCIDRGNSAAITSPPFPQSDGTIVDYRGHQRIEGSAVDIGAVEHGYLLPVPNDACANAAYAESGIFYEGDTTLATLDGDSACGTGASDVWYSYTAEFFQRLYVGYCSVEAEPVISVFSGTCGNLTELGCADSAGGSCTKVVDIVPGTYFIRLAAPEGRGGIYNLFLMYEYLAENDACADAIEVAPGGTYAGHLQNCDTDGQAPPGCTDYGNDSFRDVWFRYTPAFTQTITFDTCATVTDTVLSVHTGVCGNMLAIACNDNAPVGTPICTALPPWDFFTINSYLTVTLEADTTYFIRVAAGGELNTLGAYVLNVGLPTGIATDRHVPSQYPTIQDAVNAALPGDRVLLANGVYTGPGNRDIDPGTKDISLASLSANPDACVIDCQGAARGIIVAGGQSGATRIEGITIRNGATAAGFAGGGIAVVNSSPRIHNCRFFDNSTHAATTYGGGAIFLAGAAPVITNCIFAGNTAGVGGALYSANVSSPTILNCVFTDNSAFLDRGGAIYAFTGAPLLRNCTIVGNHGGRGGGLSLGSGIVTNTIIRGNDASIDPNLHQVGGSVTFSNLELDFIPPAPNADGNFNADARFVNPAAGDFRIFAISSCIDRGSNAGITAPPFPDDARRAPIDLGGRPRLQGPRVDVGAHEGATNNDSCQTALPISNESIPFSTGGITPDGVVASCGNSASSPQVWFAFTASCSGTATLSTCGASFDTTFAVFTGACGTLNEIACNDDTQNCASQVASYLSFPVTANSRYRVRLSGYNGASGSGTLVAACSAPTCPCDWNHDSILGSQDMFDFLTAFFTGNADYNNSGDTGSQDFFDFLACFFAGC